MSDDLSAVLKNSFNLSWRIVNFSYGLQVINSPEFLLDGFLCRLEIQPKEVECRLVVLDHADLFQRMDYVLAFIPRDGSPPLVSRGKSLQVSKEILFRTRRDVYLLEDTLTVQLHFPTSSKQGYHFTQSQIGVIRKCFLLQYKCNEVDIPRFVEVSNRYGSIEMVLTSMGGINADEHFYMKISRTNGEQCYCGLEISVLDVDGNAVNCVSDKFLFKKEVGQEKWNFPPIIKKNKLVELKDRLLPNDTLSLKCNIAFSLGIVTDQKDVLSYLEDVTLFPQGFNDVFECFNEKNDKNYDSFTDLQSDLEKLFENKTFSDVSLQVYSEKFHVHKAILAARSPVFKSLFTEGTEEIIDNLVINDVKIEILRQLLLYMYTDTIRDHHEENIMDLYVAADEYQVSSLKQKCRLSLKESLSVFNVCDILEFVDIFKDPELEKAVLDFIAENSSEVIDSDDWKLLEQCNKQLTNQALEKISLNKRL